MITLDEQLETVNYYQRTSGITHDYGSNTFLERFIQFHPMLRDRELVIDTSDPSATVKVRRLRRDYENSRFAAAIIDGFFLYDVLRRIRPIHVDGADLFVGRNDLHFLVEHTSNERDGLIDSTARRTKGYHQKFGGPSYPEVIDMIGSEDLVILVQDGSILYDRDVRPPRTNAQPRTSTHTVRSMDGLADVKQKLKKARPPTKWTRHNA